MKRFAATFIILLLILVTPLYAQSTGSSLSFTTNSTSTCDSPGVGKTVLCATPSQVTVSFNGANPIALPATGMAGAAATITIGSTSTGAAGTNAAVTNSGTSSAVVLNFAIPRGATGATGAAGTNGTNGADGKAATITVGTVTTLPAGSNATVTNSGTSSAAILDFAIPQGQAGSSTSFTSFTCTTFSVSNGVISGSNCTFH